jgi:hypothetical protein
MQQVYHAVSAKKCQNAGVAGIDLLHCNGTVHHRNEVCTIIAGSQVAVILARTGDEKTERRQRIEEYMQALEDTAQRNSANKAPSRCR